MKLDPSAIDEKVAQARSFVSSYQSSLIAALNSIGMVPQYSGHDPRVDLINTLQSYIAAQAELKLLELIQSPHFYSALMRSAAEVKS